MLVSASGHLATSKRSSGSHHNRSKVTGDPLKRWKGKLHTVTGKRVRDLYRSISADAGNPTDPVIKAKCLDCAELVTALESLRQRVAVGEISDGDRLATLARLENVLRRSLRSLGVKPRARVPVPTVAEILERK
jgi:hypothetical protein